MSHSKTWLRLLFKHSILLASMFLFGCGARSSQPAPLQLNPELAGTWSSDDGCKASFVIKNNNFSLSHFNDAKRHEFKNIDLSVAKISIFTNFSSKNSETKFSGNFSEGIITIDNYCGQPLHKTTN